MCYIAEHDMHSMCRLQLVSRHDVLRKLCAKQQCPRQITHLLVSREDDVCRLNLDLCLFRAASPGGQLLLALTHDPQTSSSQCYLLLCIPACSASQYLVPFTDYRGL